jgi:outer membrane protein OmpU
MKSILLASVSAFAFAGAAAADVSMSGSTSASYNTLDGFASSASLDFSASAELNNGWTATTSFNVAWDDFGADGRTQGNVTLSDGTSSLSFGDFDNGAAYGAVGGGLNDHQSDELSNADIFGFTGSTALGGANVAVSIDDGGNAEIGATMALGAADIAFGYGINSGDFALGVSTSMGGADLDFQTVNGTAWGLGVGYTVGSVALGFNTGDIGTWDITADYSADPLSVGVTYDNAGSWSVTAGYDMGAVSASATFADGAFSSASLSYTEGALSATLSTDGVGVEIEGSYDMGGGAVVMAGMVDDGTYVGLEYDLGNGASAAVSYSTGDIDSGDYAVGYAAGGTVGVSFEF